MPCLLPRPQAWPALPPKPSLTLVLRGALGGVRACLLDSLLHSPSCRPQPSSSHMCWLPGDQPTRLCLCFLLFLLLCCSQAQRHMDSPRLHETRGFFFPFSFFLSVILRAFLSPFVSFTLVSSFLFPPLLSFLSSLFSFSLLYHSFFLSLCISFFLSFSFFPFPSHLSHPFFLPLSPSFLLSNNPSSLTPNSQTKWAPSKAQYGT